MIAQTIVERKKVQGKIKSMTAQGMTQGVLICCMPLGDAADLLDHRHQLHAPLFSTALGLMMLLVAFVLDALGLVDDVQAGEGGRMKWRGERGQTVTEYLMISGLMVVVANFVMQWMQWPFRDRLQEHR